MAHDGKYTTLDIIPTVNKDDSSYRAEGQYIDSDKIRVENGRIEVIGGWQERLTGITGVTRDIHTWKELRNVPHYAVGTHEKLQIEQLGTLYDITPVATTVATSSILNTTNGATSVTVSAAAHDREVGDRVVFVSVENTPLDGISLVGNEYVVTSIPNAASYVIDTEVTATGSTASGGGNVLIHHLLESGRQHNGAAYGWGAGPYGVSTGNGNAWDEPRGGDGIEGRLAQWSIDNWGEDMIACRRGGKTYYWDASSSVTSRASALDTVPVSNNVAFVHPNRHLVLLGTWPVDASAIDPLEIRWSDRDNFRELAVSAATRAGSYRLQSGTEIIGYTKSKGEVLVLTDDSVWTMNSLNNELVFGFKEVATNAGLIAQHAIVDVDGAPHWMGLKNFYRYDGKVHPIPSNVRDYVFDNINYDQKEKTYAGLNKSFNEVIWLYQSNSATDDIDKYVKYNYVENTWDIGTFDRVVWHDAGTYDNPLAISTSGRVYDHEIGDTADGGPFKSYIESSYFDIEDGTDMLLVDQFIPDFVLSGALNFSIITKKWPNGPEVTKGPFTITPSTEKVDMRSRGRQAKVRFSTSALGTKWGIGKPRYRVRTDGER